MKSKNIAAIFLIAACAVGAESIPVLTTGVANLVRIGNPVYWRDNLHSTGSDM